MKSTVSYKNYVIRAESFQREKNGDWIPQYNFTRQNIASKGNDFPAQQYQLNEAACVPGCGGKSILRYRGSNIPSTIAL